ncbi:hypothetical protein BN14_08239 [Rhizoctonia solani AG-1 IB]|uniref:Uncharacterized protein n=1 Tax=Thanatephorus cucumeris (strain AG1-IB / isolate 7/3/14) TaxID=1108050 RepID=M5C408_THACB|nr:hypothetical protein BN14_08239 [Rhizoctonia solani AG-1 IB]
MPLLSLPESLARSKARFKRWLNIDIKPTTQNIAPVVQDMYPSVRSLIAQIQSSAEVFGPLKSAISELARAFEAYDAVSEERSEYKEVRTSIDQVLNDICDYVQSPTRQVMTDSMKLICVDIKAEIAAMEKKQELHTGRLVLNAIQGLDAATDCCRRVQGHLERLKINLNLSILGGIDKQIMG